MTRGVLLPGAVLGSTLVLLAGCGGDRGLARDIGDAAATAAEGDGVLDLGALVDEDWARLTFVCPYDDEQRVAEHLGFAWDDFPGTIQDEGQTLFVYSTADEVVTWARVDGPDGDPCHHTSDLPATLPRDGAVVSVVADGTSSGGETYLVLRPAR